MVTASCHPTQANHLLSSKSDTWVCLITAYDYRLITTLQSVLLVYYIGATTQFYSIYRQYDYHTLAFIAFDTTSQGVFGGFMSEVKQAIPVLIKMHISAFNGL